MTADRNRSIASAGRYRRQGLSPADQGLTASTRVASCAGQVPAGDLAVGDLVRTFDNGPQEIIAIDREVLWPGATEIPTAFWPLTVPAGALRNGEGITLLPQQGVLVESDLVRDPMGDPYAVVPSQALEGLCGIRRKAPDRGLEQIRLRFRQDEVIYAQGGVLAFCPGRPGPAHMSPSRGLPLYMCMSHEQSRELFALIRD